MKLVDQSHEILSYTDISMLETAGRTCYQSGEKIGCTLDEDNYCEAADAEDFQSINEECTDADCPNHSSHKFVKMLISKGHHAMLEFGDITVKFITNRGVTHELVRHRMCSFAQESTRYVKYDGDMEFIYPVWLGDATYEQTMVWREAMEAKEDRKSVV